MEGSSAWSFFFFSKFSARPSASVEETEVVTTKYGYILTLSQYAHESRGNHEQRVFLKERSCPPIKDKGGHALRIMGMI